jgi:hypothetical protein
MDGLEAFRVNRLRSKADLDRSDKWVRFFQPDPRGSRSLTLGYLKTGALRFTEPLEGRFTLTHRVTHLA